MSFLKGIFGRQPQIRGELGYFGLGEWWLSTFSDSERKYIERLYQPMSIGGANTKPLTEGEVQNTSQTAANLLVGLAGWFGKQSHDFSIAKRILDKADELAVDLVDRHYMYQTMIEVYYTYRETHDEALRLTIEACHKQVEIASEVARIFKKEHSSADAERIFGARLPAHVGYKQLAIILEKDKRYDAVLDLVAQAQSQGWAGDWEKREARIRKKLDR